MKAFLVLAATLFASQAAFAANIFVRDTRGLDLSNDQSARTTQMVRKAVQGMPEHRLVQSESQADFVLQPSVVTRGDESILRIEKFKEGELISSAEHSIPAVSTSASISNSNNNNALAVTEEALQKDSYVNASNSSSTSGSTSGLNDRDAMAANGARRGSSVDNYDRAGALRDQRSNRVSRDSVSGSTTSADESARAQGDSSSNQAPSNVDQPSSSPMGAGVSRGMSPRADVMNRQSYFTAGIGPSFGLGLNSDDVMYDINVGYNYNVTDQLTAKAFGDLNLGSSSDNARFINLGIGADVYAQSLTIGTARPYLTGDLGYGFTRNKASQTQDAPTIGAGVGFKFLAQQLAWDVNLHYSVLTAQLNGSTPSVLGIRAAVNF